MRVDKRLSQSAAYREVTAFGELSRFAYSRFVNKTCVSDELSRCFSCVDKAPLKG